MEGEYDGKGENMPKSLFEEFDNIIILDTETTGLDFRKDEIIEFAALRAVSRGGKTVIEDEFDLFIKLSPGGKLTQFITDLTGITQEMLDNEGVEKVEAARRFADMLNRDKTLIVAYNAQFDLQFIFYLLNDHGLMDCLKGKKMLDALTVYKDRRPYPHKLCNAIEAYDLDEENTHRAIDDTKATLTLLKAMENERNDLPKYINLFGYNPKYGPSGRKISSVTYAPQPYNSAKPIYES